MKLLALSHYENDTDTRFGDCILVFDTFNLIVYDCGHIKHVDYIMDFLRLHREISDIHIVVSHNDSDHTAGICDLLNRLHDQHRFTVQVYAHLYLKHVDEILDEIDDGRRSRERLKECLLEEFNHIREIIETAQKHNILVVEALSKTAVATSSIVGPSKEEFFRCTPFLSENSLPLQMRSVRYRRSPPERPTLRSRATFFHCDIRF